MLRSAVSLLVVIGLLANQLAAIPHTHGIASAGHDDAPHFHWAWFGFEDDHDHSHGGHDHCHLDQPHAPATNSAVQAVAASDTSTCVKALCSCFDRESHDRDSVYVPELNCTAADASAKCPTLPVPQLAGIATTTDLVANMQSFDACRRHWRPPDIVLDASDSYLTLRTLRI